MPTIHRALIILTSAALVVVSTSCGVDRRSAVVQHRRADRVLHQWHDDGGAGKVTIQISLTDQIAEFKRGGRNIGWCYVATGKEGHDTHPGTYKITEKIADKHSNIYGWYEDHFGNVTEPDAKASEKVPPGMIYVPAAMPYWMRLTSYGVGMHAGIIPEPGEPASHGCIRMPKDFVPILFDAVEVGTPVVITNAPSRNGPTSPALPAIPAMQEDWNPSRAIGGGDGGVQSVRYRDGIPVSYE